jgi:hypothetical protein
VVRKGLKVTPALTGVPVPPGLEGAVGPLGLRHRAGAARTYERLVEVLRRDLALVPDVGSQELAEHLLSEGTASTPARGNLPAPITSFLGRRDELADLAALLAPDGSGAGGQTIDAEVCRLVSPTGPGGCGKTRLAIELGHEVTSSFGDGVWLVELAALSAPALIAPAILRALEIAEDSRRGALATLTATLGTRHLLLILDNCEHLLDECAQVVAAVLGACPRLRMMATSREALSMLGETVWQVTPLPVVGQDAANEGDAVHLFVQRACAVRPGFALTPANRRVVMEVCHRLDGLPLAIELATARLSTLSVEQIAARLDARFILLSAGNRAAVPRHQTLRAAMEWSYALLDAAAQLL